MKQLPDLRRIMGLPGVSTLELRPDICRIKYRPPRKWTRALAKRAAQLCAKRTTASWDDILDALEDAGCPHRIAQDTINDLVEGSEE